METETAVANEPKVIDLLLIIDRRLRGLEDSVAKLVSSGKHVSPSAPASIIQPEALSETISLKRLSDKLSVTEEVLKMVYDVDGESLTVIKAGDGNEEVKTKNVALLVLLGQRYVLGKVDVLSSEIKRNVSENLIKTNNFGTHLKEMAPSLIRRKGKVGSHNTMYHLTALGEAQAKDLLKEMVKA